MNGLIKTLLTVLAISVAYTSHADKIMSVQELLQWDENQLALVVKMCASDESQKYGQNCKNAYRAWQIKLRSPKGSPRPSDEE